MGLYDELKDSCKLSEDEGYVIINKQALRNFCDKKDRNIAHLVEKSERLKKRHFKKTLGGNMKIISVKEKSFDIFPVAYLIKLEYAMTNDSEMWLIEDIRDWFIKTMVDRGYIDFATNMKNKKIYNDTKGLLKVYLENEEKYKEEKIVKMFEESQGQFILDVDVEKKPSNLTAIITFVSLLEVA